MERHEAGRGLKADWGWLEFAARLPAKPYPFTAQSAQVQIFPGACLYLGVTGSNNSTVGGGLALYDGQDASGVLVGRYGLVASNSFNFNAPNNGILCELGLWMNPLGVNLTGSVFVVPLWHYPFTAPGE